MSSRCRTRHRRFLCWRRHCLRRAARLGCRARCAAPRRPRWPARRRRAAWRSWAASGAPSGGELTWKPTLGGSLPTPRRPARTGVARARGAGSGVRGACASPSCAAGGCSRDNGATSAGSWILEAIFLLTSCAVPRCALSRRSRSERRPDPSDAGKRHLPARRKAGKQQPPAPPAPQPQPAPQPPRRVTTPPLTQPPPTLSPPLRAALTPVPRSLRAGLSRKRSWT